MRTRSQSSIWTLPLGVLLPLLVLGLGLPSGRVLYGQPTQPAAPPQTLPATADARAGAAALAERFAQLARDPRLGWHGSAALLEAAMRLDPDNLRHARLLADAMLQSGDRDGAIAALNLCRKLDPEDRVSQIRLIDVHAQGMETAEARYAYLSPLVTERRLPDEVRAHAAVRAAQVLFEQSRREQAADLLDLALRLNPLNMEGLRLRYAQVALGAPPHERLATLLAMVRANPADAPVTTAVARELAAAGLVGPALDWYVLGLNVAQRQGQFLGTDVLREYAAELFLNDQIEPAGRYVNQLLEADPLDVESRLLRVVLTRRQGGQEHTAALNEAENALLNRLAIARRAMGNAGATTQPIATTPPGQLPDLAEDVRRAADAQYVDQRPAFLTAVADLAWFQLSCRNRPAAARPLIEALRAMLPESDALVARLEGWSYLQEGKAAEARVKLSAVADRDPLAALGMVKLDLASSDPLRQEAARLQGQRLLSSYPSGMLGLILWDSLRDQGVKLVPPPYAAGLQEELARFPKAWLAIIERPQDFYIIRLEPLAVTHAYAQPILAKLTIQNISDFDLPIGDDAVLRPDLWFDAQLRGAVQRLIPAVAYDRLGQQVVLRARQGIQQVVRLDQGPLSAVLQENPALALQITATVLTNPMSGPQGVRPAAAGYGVQMRTVVERTGLALASEEAKQGVQTVLAGADPQQKLGSLDLLSAYVTLFRSQGQQDEALRSLAEDLAQMIGKARSDASPAVAAWAGYWSAMLATPPQRKQVMVEALADDKRWESRMLAIVAAQAPEALAAPQQKALAERLAQASGESDPLVRRLAKAWLMALAAAEPATEPVAPESVPSPATKPAAGQASNQVGAHDSGTCSPWFVMPRYSEASGFTGKGGKTLRGTSA